MVQQQEKQNNKFEEPELEASASNSGSFVSPAKPEERSLTRGNVSEGNQNDSICLAIEFYLDRLIKSGQKIPENPLRRDTPNFALIACESGIKISKLLNRNSSVRLRILEGVREIGLEPYKKANLKLAKTYNQLLEEGSEIREKELEGEDSPEQQLSNTKSALRKFVRLQGKTLDDVMGSELHDEDVRQDIAARIENLDTRRKFLNELNKWVKIHSDILANNDLPVEFSLALIEAIARSGKSVRAVAIEAEVKYMTLISWQTGMNNPTASMFPMLIKIEEVLDLPLGSLVSRVKKGGCNRRFDAEDYPEAVTTNSGRIDVRCNKSLLSELRPLLPDDFNKLPMPKREEMVVWLIENLVEPTTAWGIHDKNFMQKPYALRSWDKLFDERDLNDPVSLVLKLRDSNEPINEYFRAQLTTKYRQIIEGYDNSIPQPENIKRTLARALNSLLVNPSLFNEQIFTKEEFSNEVQNLIRQNPIGKALIRLNRLLLEEVYPNELSKDQKVPPVLELEWNELAEYKCAKIPPNGLRRADKGRWKRVSAVSHFSTTVRLYGMLKLPIDAQDPKMRGLGLNPDTFCLAMLSCVAFASAWIQWMSARRPVVQHEEEDDDENENEITTGFDASYIFFLSSLFEPKVGWLRQRKDLVKHLKLVPGYIDEQFINHANDNWNSVCNQAYRSYRDLAKNLQKVAEQCRDPFEPILPILESEMPLKAMKLFAKNVWDDIPDATIAPMRAALGRRDHLIVSITGITALRPKNIRELTYKKDNTGELRREGSEWTIEIDWKNFKNSYSPFFGKKNNKSNYRKILPDIDGLYQRIDEYIDKPRSDLLAGRQSDRLFVSTGRRVLFGARSFSNLYRKLTMKYLAHNPYLNRGIPGVKPHGPKSARDIMATHVYKQTGIAAAAAYSIQDVESTIDDGHYARFLAPDKTHFVDKIVSEAFI